MTRKSLVKLNTLSLFVPLICACLLATAASAHQLSSFAQWQVAEFSPAELANPSVSGPAGVTQNDGVTNLLRYAWGLGAHDSTINALPELVTGNDILHMRYHKSTTAADIFVRVESSTDMNNWHSEPVIQNFSAFTVTGPSGVTGVVAQDFAPVTATVSRFLRLKVSQVNNAGAVTWQTWPLSSTSPNLPVTAGGTGAATTAQARVNLGLTLANGAFDPISVSTALERVTSTGASASWPQGKTFVDTSVTPPRLHVFYYQGVRSIGGMLGIMHTSRSLADAGAAFWSNPEISLMATGTPSNSIIMSYAISVHPTSGDFYALVDRMNNGGPYESWLIKSTNKGVSWQDVQQVTTPAGFQESGKGWEKILFVNDGTHEWIVSGFRVSVGDEGRVGVLRIRFDTPTIQEFRDIITAAEATTNGWVGQNRYTEPEISWDPVSSRLVGWIRHNNQLAPNPIWVSSGDFGVTWTRSGLDSSAAVLEKAADRCPIPTVRLGEKYYSLLVERYGKCRIFLLDADVNAAVQAGQANAGAFRATLLGDLGGRETNLSYISSSPVGNTAAAVHDNKIYWFFGAYDSGYGDVTSEAVTNIYCLAMDFSPQEPNALFSPQSRLASGPAKTEVYDLTNSTQTAIMGFANAVYSYGGSKTDLSVQLPINGEVGDTITLVNAGSGAIRLATAGGAGNATILAPNGEVVSGGGFLSTTDSWKVIRAIKISANQWMIEGPNGAPAGANDPNYNYLDTTAASRHIFRYGTAVGAQISAGGVRIKSLGTISAYGGVDTGPLTFTSVPGGGTALSGNYTLNGAQTAGSNQRGLIVYPQVSGGLLLSAEVTGANTVRVKATNPSSTAVSATIPNLEIIYLESD